MRKNVLIIGAGGAGQVVVHNCAQNNKAPGDIHVASRTLEKCQRTIARTRQTNGG